VFTSILADATAPALAADANASAGGFDPMTLILLAVFAIFIFMMFRRQKATKKAQQEQQAKMATGVSVMTNFGLYGTVLAIDEAENKVVLELSPGNTATVHRQTITKIIAPEQSTDTVPDDASSLTGDSSYQAEAGESTQETLARLNRNGENQNNLNLNKHDRDSSNEN
jgi:preprotein translocase subunit YajC